MRKIKIGDKTYEIKEVDGSESQDEEETTEETEEVETPAEETTEEGSEDDTDEGVEEKLDEVAEKVVASLGIKDIREKLDALVNENKSSAKAKKDSQKIKGLLDLEKLMNKDLNKMTSREKIVGFFQGMIQNDQAVMKALSEGTAADGGYLFPDEFRAEIIRDIQDQPRMRNEVTVIPMRRDIMNIPTLASRPQVTWTDENATKSTTTAHFGQVTLTVKKMAAILYASDELIEDSTEIDIVNFIISLFSEAIGMEEDRVIWRGNGTTEPTGIHGHSSINTVSGATGLSVDLMVDLVHELPQRYHRNAKIYAHRTNIREMRKLKDNNNRYYFVDPASAEAPATFMGYPVVEANELPESAIYFGDLRQTYWLGDRRKMTVKVSQETETAFTKDQTAIRVVSRIAGNVVLGASCKALTNLP